VTLFRLDAQGDRARRATVALGRGSARQVEVLRGLAAGDTVIVSDTSAFGASSDVRLK
jgi:hypothetical protein